MPPLFGTKPVPRYHVIEAAVTHQQEGQKQDPQQASSISRTSIQGNDVPGIL